MQLLKGSPAFCRRCGNIPHRRPENAQGHFHAKRNWLCDYCDPRDGKLPETDLFTPAETMSVWGGAWKPKHPLGPAAIAATAETLALRLMNAPILRIGLDGELHGAATCATPRCLYAVSQNRVLICKHQGMDNTCLYCALTKRLNAEEKQKQMRLTSPRRRKE